MFLVIELITFCNTDANIQHMICRTWTDTWKSFTLSFCTKKFYIKDTLTKHREPIHKLYTFVGVCCILKYAVISVIKVLMNL